MEEMPIILSTQQLFFRNCLHHMVQSLGLQQLLQYFLQCDTAPQAWSVCFGKGDLTLKESISHFPRILQLELRGTDHLSLIYSTINTNLRTIPTDMWFENKKAGQRWKSEADVRREQR